MNQRVENELRSILNDLEKLGLLENELISDCLKKDGIRIPNLNSRHLTVLLGLLFIGLGYYGFFSAGVLYTEEEKISITRDVPASVGRNNTLFFPAQVQIERDGRYVERWHWDYGEYGDLNGFIHRFNCDTTVEPLTVICYRQAEKFKNYNPAIKPLPRSLAFSWSADKFMHYGVLDEQSRNHGLWVKFSEDQAIEAELWNHGRQVGLTKLSDSGEWEIQVKVKEFNMPQDPVTAWQKVNDGFFDVEYAKTLISLEHDTILFASTLGKLIFPHDQSENSRNGNSLKVNNISQSNKPATVQVSLSSNPWIDWEGKFKEQKRKVVLLQAWYHDDPTYIDGSVPRRGPKIDISSLSNEWVDVFLQNCYRDGRIRMLEYLKLHGYEPVASKGKK